MKLSRRCSCCRGWCLADMLASRFVDGKKEFICGRCPADVGRLIGKIPLQEWNTRASQPEPASEPLCRICKRPHDLEDCDEDGEFNELCYGCDEAHQKGYNKCWDENVEGKQGRPQLNIIPIVRRIYEKVAKKSVPNPPTPGTQQVVTLLNIHAVFEEEVKKLQEGGDSQPNSIIPIVRKIEAELAAVREVNYLDQLEAYRAALMLARRWAKETDKGGDSQPNSIIPIVRKLKEASDLMAKYGDCDAVYESNLIAINYALEKLLEIQRKGGDCELSGVAAEAETQERQFAKLVAKLEEATKEEMRWLEHWSHVRDLIVDGPEETVEGGEDNPAPGGDSQPSQKMDFEQEEEENAEAMVCRLMEAGWTKEDAEKEWERIQHEEE